MHGSPQRHAELCFANVPNVLPLPRADEGPQAAGGADPGGA